jgi:hypothetical protein
MRRLCKINSQMSAGLWIRFSFQFMFVSLAADRS